MCSTFEKFNKKILVRISKEIINKGFDYNLPYNDIDDNITYLNGVTMYYGEGAQSIDVEFFSKFILENKNNLEQDKTNLDDIVIPTCKKYKFRYSVFETVKQRSDYTETWDCYEKFWVLDSVNSANNDGSWDYWEGNLIDTENIDSEFDDIGFNQKVQEINEISENLNKLNKTALLEIKKLIDKKLKS